MNYTEKYHLPQWVKEDRIMMEDFNQMCADLEAGLSRDKASAEAGIAQAKAAAEEAAAAKPYVVGTYSGKTEKITINVGFKPSFLIIAAHDANSYGFKGGIFGQHVTSSRIQFTKTGFTASSHSATNFYPMVNCEGYSFVYIAFR